MKRYLFFGVSIALLVGMIGWMDTDYLMRAAAETAALEAESGQEAPAVQGVEDWVATEIPYYEQRLQQVDLQAALIRDSIRQQTAQLNVLQGMRGEIEGVLGRLRAMREEERP